MSVKVIIIQEQVYINGCTLTCATNNTPKAQISLPPQFFWTKSDLENGLSHYFDPALLVPSKNTTAALQQ